MHAMYITYMVVGSLIKQKYLTDVQLINLLGVGSYLTCINIALHGVTVVYRQLAIQVTYRFRSEAAHVSRLL